MVGEKLFWAKGLKLNGVPINAEAYQVEQQLSYRLIGVCERQEVYDTPVRTFLWQKALESAIAEAVKGSADHFLDAFRKKLSVSIAYRESSGSESSAASPVRLRGSTGLTSF
jgi:hypothetical protein